MISLTKRNTRQKEGFVLIIQPSFRGLFPHHTDPPQVPTESHLVDMYRYMDLCKHLKHFLSLRPDSSLVPKISEIKLILLSFVLIILHQTSSFEGQL